MQESVIQMQVQEQEQTKKKVASMSDMKTTKLILTSEADHPFSKFQTELKNRGIKDCDLNDTVVAALQEVPESWWQQKIEQFTPLEFRINSALSDPHMRQKLSEFLAPTTQH